MPPRKLPEVKLSFLPGDEPWQLIDASTPRQLDRISVDEQQLIAWCTLPLATELIRELVLDPMVTEGMRHGFHMVEKDYLLTDFDKDIAKTQREMKSGSARPAYVHLANNPDESHMITVLMPTAQNRYRHVFFGLLGEYKIRSLRGDENIANPPQHVALKRKMSIMANKSAADVKLDIPRKVKKQ